MRKRYSLIITIVLTLLIFLFSSGVSICFAQEKQNENLIDISPAIDSLPDDIKDILPDETEDTYSSPEKMAEHFDIEYLIDLSVGILKKALSSMLVTFALTASLILISATLSSLGNAFSQGGALSTVWSLAGTLCIGYCAYSMIRSHVGEVIDFAKNISTFMKSLSAVVGAVYTSSGEIGSAATHGIWIFSATTVCEELCGKLLLPLLQISFSATLTTSVMSGVNLNKLVQTIRNAFTSVLVFLMTLISVILAFQTVISHTSDTLAMRGVRYAIVHSVPVIGGLVSDSSRTLATSFALMKNSVGFVGIVIIIVLSLYPLVGLLASKYTLQLSSSFSSILSEDKCCVFLDESVKMINFLIAVVIMLDVAFIFCLSIFALLPSASA